jgi:pyruvate/2-oxoglutarate dehydrogenase complex dihydrolipoamide acyltransferase (E2) component
VRLTVKLPKLSEAADDVVILEWLVDVGSTVAENTDLVSVETDKAIVTVPSPVAGTVLELLVGVEDEVTTGTPIAVIDNG